MPQRAAMLQRSAVLIALAMMCAPLAPASAGAPDGSFRVASGPPQQRQDDGGKNGGKSSQGDTGGKNDQADQGGKDDKGDKEELSPEQKMAKRFPQPVRVGDLIGLPVLDEDDSTIGYVRDVVRTNEGKVALIVPYSAWFGWARTERGKRPVAVPIETVAILARQIDVLDMARSDFDEADTWQPSQGKPIPPEEKTSIALGRR